MSIITYPCGGHPLKHGRLLQHLAVAVHTAPQDFKGSLHSIAPELLVMLEAVPKPPELWGRVLSPGNLNLNS